jgi:hypothetical protein
MRLICPIRRIYPTHRWRRRGGGSTHAPSPQLLLLLLFPLLAPVPATATRGDVNPLKRLAAGRRDDAEVWNDRAAVGLDPTRPAGDGLTWTIELS